MDIQQLFRDYGIHYITEGNKHCTPGWINVHCPFCPGSRNYHLGISKDGTGANCWRCGGHTVAETVSILLGIPAPKAREIIQKYRGRAVITRKKEEPKVAIFPLRLPRPNSSLTGPYKRYLEKRGFDPDKLIKEWGISQTGPISYLDGISYSHRILIPINWAGEMVSFQTRDITGKSELKYLACPKRREKINHKTIVYGKEAGWKEESGIIVVEGVTDVWRLGPHAVATFGIEFKLEQVLKLARINQRFYILFDAETQAQTQARKLSTKLKALGKSVKIIDDIKTDPADLSQDDADYLVKQLIKRKRGKNK